MPRGGTHTQSSRTQENRVEQDELPSARRLARHLGVTESAAKLMINRGILGSVVVGRIRYVPTSEADRWSKLGEAPQRDPAPTRATPTQPNLSAVERARAGLDQMRSGSWARPDGWTPTTSTTTTWRCVRPCGPATKGASVRSLGAGNSASGHESRSGTTFTPPARPVQCDKNSWTTGHRSEVRASRPKRRSRGAG